MPGGSAHQPGQCESASADPPRGQWQPVSARGLTPPRQVSRSRQCTAVQTVQMHFSGRLPRKIRRSKSTQGQAIILFLRYLRFQSVSIVSQQSISDWIIEWAFSFSGEECPGGGAGWYKGLDLGQIEQESIRESHKLVSEKMFNIISSSLFKLILLNSLKAELCK